MDTLSAELVLYLAEFLTDREFLKLAATCRQYHRLCTGSRSLAVRAETQRTPDWMFDFCARWPKIWRLVFANSTVRNEHLRACDRLQAVKSLMFHRVFLAGDQAINLTVWKHRRTLENLSISESTWPGVCALGSHFQRLVAVYFNDCDLQDSTLHWLQECPHLETMAVSNCKRLTATGVACLQYYKSLVSLVWVWMNTVVSELVLAICGLQTLRHVFFEHLYGLCAAHIHELSKCPNLESFHAAYCTSLYDGSVFALCAFPTLRVVHLECCSIRYQEVINVLLCSKTIDTICLYQAQEEKRKPRKYIGAGGQTVAVCAIFVGFRNCANVRGQSNWGCELQGCTKIRTLW